MANPDLAKLEAIARDAMRTYGHEPDLPPAASSQLAALHPLAAFPPAAPLSVRATYPAVLPFDHAIRSPGGVAETPASLCPPDPTTSCTRCACGVPAVKFASNGLSSTM